MHHSSDSGITCGQLVSANHMRPEVGFLARIPGGSAGR